jgi:hypothetical protein
VLRFRPDRAGTGQRRGADDELPGYCRLLLGGR